MSKNRILLAAIILLIVTGYVTTRFVNFSDGKNNSEELQAAQTQEGEERQKQPLRITEVSPLDEQFLVYFCTNGELRWRALSDKRQHDSDPEILWSYQIQTRSGRYLHGTDLRLEANIARAKYQKQNDESSSCYQFQMSPILMRVPYLRYQTGNIAVPGLNLSELELKERNRFYNSIKSAQISFLNPATKEVVLSFITAPSIIEAQPTP
jgi:hypothetical protein